MAWISFATRDTDGTIIFYFRHWIWSSPNPDICQITSRDEAARFIREQYRRARFLPEMYRKNKC
nr:hypothetical protein [uncultured Methanoregula sp.]